MKRIKSLSIFVVVAVIVPVLVAGCMGRKYVERDTYALDVSRPGTVSSVETDAVLRVRTMSVSPRYERKSFVYRSGDLSYETDYYNQFFASPDIMITEEVREWLGESGLFRQVFDYTGQAEHTHVLEGEVIDLYGDFSRGTQPKAAIDVRFRLIRETSGRSEILFQKHYRREIPIGIDTAENLVGGWNKALEGILTDFEKDLKGLDLNKEG
jgi:cholesterol transport system auxiliary component